MYVIFNKCTNMIKHIMYIKYLPDRLTCTHVYVNLNVNF